MSWQAWAGLLVPPLLMAGVLGSVAVRPAPVSALTAPPVTCAAPPGWTVAYAQDAGGVTPQGTGWHLGGVSVLTGTVCTPGTLTIRAAGTVVDGQAARLEVSVGGQPLASLPFGGPGTVRVRVPQAGRVALAYLNDVYRAEVRAVTLSGLDAAHNVCGVQAAGRGASWNAAQHVAGLTWSGPLILTPCRPGTLRVRVQGRSGGGVLPVVQAGRQRVAVAEGWTAVELDAPGPVSVSILNPLNRTTADRNLDVLALSFAPD